jgi:hypothetical protein
MFVESCPIIQRIVVPEFEGHHANQVRYKSGRQLHPGATSVGNKPGNY